ncbi:alpha-amylase family glycosyl hydrolase [Opitutus terrae]|uniref:Glycoside hydrolase family 13 domain protein n=1 Tax=Opitutus terrae (strain DSM 11246 / JCM 15787 / PB90-1) TaxID=452637 RepID=B1ZZ30_OPITP|nr:alpha-amylase family glycosyl hydrolase [Opitutus terrae]ACB77102.1 glycoside hydrolase family 13 domain protein [Opitutus terrae PB90-1]
MASPGYRIIRAWLESLTSGVVELDRDWLGARPPQFSMGQQCPVLGGLAPASRRITGSAFGYRVEGNDIVFVLPELQCAGVDVERDGVYLGGDFNGWQQAVGLAEWRMQRSELEGESVLSWSGPAARFFDPAGQRFKFVTGEHQWLSVPDDAANAVRDADGNINRAIDPARTGRHLWSFVCPAPLDLAESLVIGWAAELTPPATPLVPGRFFYQLKTDLPLGALVREGETVFRLFAPRARSVTLFISPNRAGLKSPQQVPLARRPDADGRAGVWEVALNQRLHGWFYWYVIDGVREGRGAFDPTQRVLDPYALAALGREGPGIVLDRAWVGQGDRGFRTPAWQDLVIAEAHVRDLATHAPVPMTPAERRGFSGLRRWVEHPEFYLHRLGVNCVELQPVHEFDNHPHDHYHWGYMTNSFFSPESSYALDPAEGSAVRELQDLVRAFHGRGMAVLLDVVYNHVGVPPHLMFIDRLYYFEQHADGRLVDWSGCGNDLRANSAMARRLIIDSCVHMIEAYGVDGFRFDLAELLGVEVLREIEAALKRVKPDVVLIAEPWSFRAHIASRLRDTGWASWNDGFRDFLRKYVRGEGDARRMEYFLKGSPWYFAKWPAQTVNYTESHDDRTWIDMITEHHGYDGFAPTRRDVQRTHLMAALLFMSVGIPMLAAGQDFLRSKRGVSNTYLRGDLNALDYRRLFRYPGTHSYFAEWIAFRRSWLGRLVRHYERVSDAFFQFFHLDGAPAFAVVYNADRSLGPERLLFAVNPTQADLIVPLDEATAGAGWRQLANRERFINPQTPGATQPVEPALFVSALGCGLWVSDS